MAFDPKRIPTALVEAYAKSRVAVLVGAGASKNAGLPLWAPLLESMIKEAEDNHYIDAAKAAECRALVTKPDKFLMVAAWLKDAFGPAFDAFIEKIFIGPKPAPTDLHASLVAMDRLQFFLTTNYDTLLERAYRTKDPDVSVCTYKEVGEIQRRLARREFFILKAHGDAAKAGNGVILTSADYRNLLYRHRAYQSLLSSMFTMYSMIFVGASLADPEIRLLLEYIVDSFNGGSGPVHYALMAQEDITEVEKNQWFRDFNVQFIPISKADDYAELPEFLKALHAAV